jgi:hypothetical protein
MRRVAAGLALIALVLLVAGCEDARQRSARESLQTYLRGLPNEGGYRVDATRCSPSGRVAFVNVVATTLFICVVHRTDGVCDRFDVRVSRDRPAVVVLARRDAGCVVTLG